MEISSLIQLLVPDYRASETNENKAGTFQESILHQAVLAIGSHNVGGTSNGYLHNGHSIPIALLANLLDRSHLISEQKEQ